MKMQRIGAAGFCLMSALALAVAVIDAAPGAEPRLAQAVKDRDAATIKTLLQQRVDVNPPLADGSTALHWAVYWNDKNTVDLLVRAGAQVNAANRVGATPLWMAASSGYADIVQALVNAGADAKGPALGGEPVLMTAARAGSVEAVRALLARGADVNAKEAQRGQTALMWAVGGRDSHPDVVRVLLEHGADVTARSAGGLTALLFAIRQGDLESTRLLVEANADINDRAVVPGGKMAVFGDTHWSYPSADTSTALTMAINNSRYEIATLLLEKGADPNIASDPYPYKNRPNHTISGETLKPGLTSLHALASKRARSQGDSEDKTTLALMKALIARGADVNARTPSVRAPKIQQLNPQPAITWVEAGAITPFWISANALDVDAMHLLMASGADPSIVSMERTTPLMVAAGLGAKTRGPASNLGRRGRLDLKVLQLLLDSGIDINAQNEHGQTALHGAAFAAAHEAVKFLLDHGARPDLRDSLNRRPLEVAHDSNRVEYRPSLQDHNPEDVAKTIALLEKVTVGDKP